MSMATRRIIVLVAVGIMFALTMTLTLAHAAADVSLSSTTELRAIWEWFEDDGTYNYFEVNALQGSTNGTTDCYAVVSWVRDFGDGPEVYATGFAQLDPTALALSNKSLGSAKLKVPVTFDWGIEGQAVLDLQWKGTGRAIVDTNVYSDVDPVMGIAISRDTVVGRFATVTGSVALPEIGISNVTTWDVDEYYPPYILNSMATSIQSQN
jgi:hypothetical protein